MGKLNVTFKRAGGSVERSSYNFLSDSDAYAEAQTRAKKIATEGLTYALKDGFEYIVPSQIIYMKYRK